MKPGVTSRNRAGKFWDLPVLSRDEANNFGNHFEACTNFVFAESIAGMSESTNGDSSHS